MRTINPTPIREYEAVIDLMIWSEPGVEYTYEELYELIKDALMEKPWLGDDGKPVFQRIGFRSNDPENPLERFGPAHVNSSGSRLYRCFATVGRIPEGKMRAYGNFTTEANQRIRKNAPSQCQEIFTRLRFEAFLGPDVFGADIQ